MTDAHRSVVPTPPLSVLPTSDHFRRGAATVQSVSKGQLAYCKFNPQFAAGDYSLEIATVVAG